jgi:hypothetical protein
MINTNMIEGVWRDMKLKISKRNYNEGDLPGKLMEYLWRRANKDNIKIGMERCLREVSFNSDIVSRIIENDDNGIITRGENGNPPEVEAVFQARAAARREADLRRYLARNRRTNTGYENDLARVMLGRAYEDQLRNSHITEPEVGYSSSEDSDFSFGDSDLDYNFDDSTIVDVPAPLSPSLAPASPPLSPVPTVFSPVVPDITPVSNTSTRGRPRGSSSVGRSRGRGRRATTSRTSRR